MSETSIVQHSHFWYGGDYNPDQWPEEIWQEDVRLMREAGVNLVSLGIFSWARLEPEPGEYDFAWLDDVVELLLNNGVQIDLATATASPPPWMAKLYPESLPVTADGVTLSPGGRQQYCPNSVAYRKHAAELVRRLAERYGNHPAVVMWHVGNEYGCHVSECFCDESAAAFRVWLQKRYGTLARLNEAWGTAFWSQRYGDWDEILPPRRAPTFPNPTQQLDWKRFSSDSILECFEIEHAILKEVTPNIPVTTNFMGLFKPLDYWKWAKKQDIISHDCYPDPADPRAIGEAAITYDLMRSLGNGRPWLLMEQTTGQVNWRPENLLKHTGQMRLWSYQTVARGSNGVMFFQWRASRAGAEKFHSGMVPHVGTENSRIWREVVQLGNELSKLEELLPGRVPADVAIMLDWDSWWALELDSKPSVDLKLLDQIATYYAPLFQRNITVDFVPPGGDLSGYRLLLLPNLYLVRDEHAAAINDYVEHGGTVVMSFFSGIVNEDEHIRLGGYPAPFRKLLGIRVEEFEPLVPGDTNTLQFVDGSTASCSLWADLLDLEGAEPLASFKNDFYAERPAITRNSFGNGAAYYLGTRPDTDAMAALLERICQESHIRPAFDAPAGVEAVRRETDRGSYLFLLNHNTATVNVTLSSESSDLLSGERVAGTIPLEPYGVAILKTNSAPPAD